MVVSTGVSTGVSRCKRDNPVMKHACLMYRPISSYHTVLQCCTTVQTCKLIHTLTYVTYIHADIDECAVDNGHCEHVCTNAVGSYQCSCRRGHFLAVNGRNCVGKNSTKTDASNRIKSS